MEIGGFRKLEIGGNFDEGTVKGNFISSFWYFVVLFGRRDK